MKTTMKKPAMKRASMKTRAVALFYWAREGGVMIRKRILSFLLFGVSLMNPRRQRVFCCAVLAAALSLAALDIVMAEQSLVAFTTPAAAAAQSGLGSKIVFTSTQHIVPEPPPGLDADSRAQIYIMNGDGTDQRPLTDFLGFKIGAVCSPNGRQIAFQNTPLILPLRPTIFLMNVDGSDLTPLVSGGTFPTWSPDGKRIAFQGVPAPGRLREIFVINVDGTGLTNLTNDPADDYRPDWSPDGRKIAFTSNRHGHDQIYVMNADGSEVTRLTFTEAARDLAPDWSPNGRGIVFQSNRDHPDLADIDQPGFDIYVMNADGSEVTQLTKNLNRDLDPAWSPNGRQIVFDSDRDVALTRQLYAMNADGSDQMPLTGRPGENSHAGWCQGYAAEP
jgi:Tol biopolymer transport system component